MTGREADQLLLAIKEFLLLRAHIETKMSRALILDHLELTAQALQRLCDETLLTDDLLHGADQPGK